MLLNRNLNTLTKRNIALSLPQPHSKKTVFVQSSHDESVRQLEAFSANVRKTLSTTATSEVASSTGVAVAVAVANGVPKAPSEGLFELNKDIFDSFLAEAGETLVVVDFYTDWCGPCKMIYPELVKLSSELAPRATIAKLNCNKQNKDLGVKLGIKVAPTFHLYRNSQKVAEMTGAKVEKLKALILEHIDKN